MTKAKRNVEILQEEEERYWRAQVREDWLMWGGRNIKWFHHKATFRRRKNHIKGIMDECGRWVKNKRTIGEIATTYFMNLFSCSSLGREKISKITECIQRKVTNEHNEALKKNFNRHEVEFAVKNMNPTKAPSPDGMHAIFYKQYWDIVGNDVVDLCLKVLNGQEGPGDLNETFISLILKSKSPTRLLPDKSFQCNL